MSYGFRGKTLHSFVVCCFLRPLNRLQLIRVVGEGHDGNIFLILQQAQCKNRLNF